MYQYYVSKNKQEIGKHEVHREGCEKMPIEKVEVGQHHECAPAIKQAEKMGYSSTGCAECSLECRESITS